MATICPNCKSKLSCGCQKRQASNGASVCSTCLSTYEAALKNSSQSKNGTAPSNVSVLYHKPG